MANEWCHNNNGRHTWTLTTGVEVVVENIWDWAVFCDVFVNREYPLHIVPQRDRIANILDLGANVGYFSLLAAHECLLMQQPYRIQAVEGNKSTYTTLLERVKRINANCWLYLAGKQKKEYDFISQSANHGTSAVVSKRSSYPKEHREYLDLNILFEGETIDIMKCDIEGSEYDLAANYPDLLKRTNMVYMEVHYLKEAKELREAMKDYGFNFHRVLLNRKTTQTEVWARV